MNEDCYPVAALPHTSALFRDYVSGAPGVLESFYSPLRNGAAWMEEPAALDPATRSRVVELLTEQNKKSGAGTETLANLERLAAGANVVVTGQQVGLLGGPLLTLMKAATAIRRAADASRAGHPHVPIFWLASEDHDLAEVDHAVFPEKTPETSEEPEAAKLQQQFRLRTLRLGMSHQTETPVGGMALGAGIVPLLEELRQLLGDGPAYALLASLYKPEATYAEAFGKLLMQVFARHGLIVIDAASRGFHALARPVLRAAIEQAIPLRTALLERSRALEAAGYPAQVLVGDASSLLFLLDETTGVRRALKVAAAEKDADWTDGNRAYTQAELLAILEAAPERLSPNALLRPVMQDALLPTSAYIGGPAEIAYFAQSQVVYRRILGRVTPILPRLSATLVERGMARLLARHGLELTDVFTQPEELAQRLGARYMPVEGKRRLSAAGETLDGELTALTAWMEQLDAGLGRSGKTAASKMRYQMNRLRRMTANFELKKEQSLRLHARELCGNLFPAGQLQERVVAAAWFLQHGPEELASLLVERAGGSCAGHASILL